jgi:ABC-type oligopeptide transport system ATPase subunit
VEAGIAEEVYRNPREAYTRRLIEAVPKSDLESIRARREQRIAAQRGA